MGLTTIYACGNCKTDFELKNGSGKLSNFEYISYLCHSCKKISVEKIPFEDPWADDGDYSAYDMAVSGEEEKVSSTTCSNCHSKEVERITSLCRCPICQSKKFSQIFNINWD
jgi:DNA-directed RNA polymerase subunit RPC12/RpoP